MTVDREAIAHDELLTERIVKLVLERDKLRDRCETLVLKNKRLAAHNRAMKKFLMEVRDRAESWGRDFIADIEAAAASSDNQQTVDGPQR